MVAGDNFGEQIFHAGRFIQGQNQFNDLVADIAHACFCILPLCDLLKIRTQLDPDGGNNIPPTVQAPGGILLKGLQRGTHGQNSRYVSAYPAH